MRTFERSFLILVVSLLSLVSAPAAEPIQVLYFGDNGHHRPAERFRQLQPVLGARGINLTYTDKLSDFNAETLAKFDGLMIYANTTKIEPEQEQALLEYVAGGKGLIPLHCASYCFLNSEKYIALVGAQFQRHGTGVFRTELANGEHPLVRGFGGFESWDETYVHTKHNDQHRTVLEYRQEGDRREPWTWVRTHGKGRVFYTAWGHDERTWGNPGFHNLVERGVRWAVGADLARVPAFVDPKLAPPPKMTELAKNLKPFEYVDVGAKIPNYRPGKAWGTQERPLSQMQLPLPAEESRKHYITPVGFELQLFASEADFGGNGKPIAMTWDQRGRLWLCETLDYPNELAAPGQGRDRIRICEDTNGDGKADKFTVFAENLSIPTAIAFHRGGVIVQDGVRTLYLKDTSGDDVADIRETLITGWALGDTHGGVSNFQYGHDNWIWAMQGYNNSEPEFGGKKQAAFRMGFFRFRLAPPPRGLTGGEPPQSHAAVAELEFVRSTNNNTWGLGISEEGVVFGSTANHNPSVYMPIANRYYEAVRGWSPQVLGTIADTHLFKPITDRIRQVDQHGGYTAGAGHALYTARTYPSSYWNRTAFVCGPTGHLVGTFVLSSDGADYRSTSPWNLVASDDEWAAPIMAEVGPDGNVWVLDWYNYIIQHNPTPVGFKNGKGNAYESDLRDKRHGRIYRVVHKAPGRNSPAAATSSLSAERPAELVAALARDNLFWRRHAQRLLVERGQMDVAPQLIELVRNPAVDEVDLNVGAIHALWTLHGLGLLDGGVAAEHAQAFQAAASALAHPSAGVRRNALQVLPRNEQGLQELLRSSLLSDTNGQVRLAAILALAEMPASAAGGAKAAELLTANAVLADRWLPDAVTAAAARHDVHFLRAIAGENSPVAGKAPALERVQIVAEHLARGGDASAVLAAIIPLPTAPSDVQARVLAGVEKGWPKAATVKLSPAQDEQLAGLLEKLAPESRGALVSLARRWGSQKLEKYWAQISADIRARLADGKLAENARIAAARQLVEFSPSDPAVAAELLALITVKTSPELSTGLIEALAASQANETGDQLIAALAQFTPSVRSIALRTILSRTAWTVRFISAVEKREAALDGLTLEQKQALAAHPDGQLANRARKLLTSGAGLPNPDRQKVIEEYLPLTRETGDAIAGKEIFKKQCSKCHMHSGEGNKIGPDLTGMAVHPKGELLVHMLDPSRSVEGNYRIYQVLLDDGRVLSGLLASESKTAIELIDAEGKRHSLVRDEIDTLQPSTKSLMPEGFEKQVSRADISNLLEFLTKRGKFLPLPLDKAATIVSTRGMFISENSDPERLIFPDWSPKTFEGVPFVLVDPQGDRTPNVILLHGPSGKFPPTMPKAVKLPCNAPAKLLHLLSGVSGWGHPYGQEGSVTLIVRLHYADGKTEDHPLKNGVHFADYIRRVDVPGSKFAYQLRGQQIRYLQIAPQRAGETIREIELVKGPDGTAPIVMAITAEGQ